MSVSRIKIGLSLSVGVSLVALSSPGYAAGTVEVLHWWT